jgi:hypothetical protein
VLVFGSVELARGVGVSAGEIVDSEKKVRLLPRLIFCAQNFRLS